VRVWALTTSGSHDCEAMRPFGVRSYTPDRAYGILPARCFMRGSDDRVTRIRIYPDVNEALKAVGLAG
jgi:hypothetical protein